MKKRAKRQAKRPAPRPLEERELAQAAGGCTNENITSWTIPR